MLPFLSKFTNITMKVLGIESSCDETGIAIYDSDHGLLAEALFSQVDIHQKYGGVVPELASRDHIRKTLPLIREVMQKAGCDKNDMAWPILRARGLLELCWWEHPLAGPWG